VEVSELLETRSKELKGVQAFLSTADSFSGADITSMVQSLNTEIHQIAANLVDELPWDAALEADQEAIDVAREAVGERVVHLLVSKRSHEYFEPLLQSAVQASLVGFCRGQILKWTDSDESLGTQLGLVYAELSTKEDQTVSGRWRSLARKYAKNHSSDEDQIAELVPELFTTVGAVLNVGGWNLRRSKARRYLTNKCTNGFNEVVQLVVKLDRAMGEEVTSKDYHVITVKPGAEFNAENHVDAFAAEQDGRIGKVLCTCDLGLLSIIRGVPMKRTLLLKPNVVQD
ncbi:hypothetical protein C8J56DRAFT_719552, partial [Mycena floridula]